VTKFSITNFDHYSPDLIFSSIMLFFSIVSNSVYILH